MNKKIQMAFCRIQKMLKHTWGSTLLLLATPSAFADLPTMQAPSRGNGGGLLDTIKNYAYDGFVLVGLLVSAIAFYKVAGALLEGFSEVSAGRKKWGDLGAIGLVGVVLIVVIIWLVTQAKDIL